MEKFMKHLTWYLKVSTLVSSNSFNYLFNVSYSVSSSLLTKKNP